MMSNLSDLEQELGNIILDNLNIEGISLEDIEPEAALFNDGLGLDSIDSLEMGMLLSTNYGIQLRSDDPDISRIFSSLRALAKYVDSNKKTEYHPTTPS